MILQTIMNKLYGILDTLLAFNIPNLPDEALEYINTMFDYLVAGVGILANYTPLAYLLTLFGVVLAVDAGVAVYHFIMWIIRKIPMIGVS